MISSFINLTKEIYGDQFIALHRPVFEGKEKEYLINCVDSNFVSSVGELVVDFERRVAALTGSTYGIATVNGTSALHASLALAGVQRGDEVLTQALSFVATANAIAYLGATPILIDVDRETLGMSPEMLRKWLEANSSRTNGQTINRTSGARIAACVPMHTFGMPLRITEIVSVCQDFDIPLIEDAAESFGSYIGNRHTGTFGKMSTLSFNGNKIITTGGGGMILTNDEELARRARHLTTTAKVPHRWEFFHDEIGFNYRMPNLNAAIGCAQIENLPKMLEIKAEIASRYRQFCRAHGLDFVDAPAGTSPNYWLNAVILENRAARDAFLEATNAAGVMTRPIWRLMHELPMYSHCQHDGLANSRWLADRVVNLPSSVPESEFHRLKA